MAGIVASKKYHVKHTKGNFKILISEHYDGTYYGGILRNERHAGMDEDQGSRIHIQQQKFIGSSEEYIYNLCAEWLHNNLGKDFQISFEGKL